MMTAEPSRSMTSTTPPQLRQVPQTMTTTALNE
jgi:hypothetical protein